MKKMIAAAVMAVILFAWGWNEASAAELSGVLKDIKLNGFVSTSYNYNFRDKRDIVLRDSQINANSFNLDIIELVFQKEATAPGDVGFRTDLTYGYTVPKAMRSSWFGTTQGAFVDNNKPFGQRDPDDFDIQQAYVRYIAPLGSGLTLDLGKFVTDIGGELIEGYDGWNYNYSRSFLFYFADPFMHTGLRGTYKFTDQVSIVGWIVNGWDNNVDNNKAKTVGANLILTPMANTTINVKFITGPEQDNNTSNLRNVAEIYILQTIDKLTLNLDYIHGTEKNVPGGYSNSKWDAVQGIVRYAASDRYAINVRGEVFKDSTGSRLATTVGQKQKLWGVTVTPEFTLNKNMIIRPEYRHDVADQKIFNKNGTPNDAKTQDTVALNVFYYF
jgi:hypothetical protein